LQTIPAAMTNRGESWYFTIQVSDHYNYSNVYSASVIIIVNSAPSASSVQINGGSILVYTTDELVVSWVFIDPDPLDVEDLSSTLIRWYLNGELQTQYTNQSSIPTAVTVKDQVWQVVIAVRDNGGLWSMVVYSSSLLIKNSPPNTVIYTDNHPEFIVEDEELQLNISLYGSTDADGDEDRPNIWWFINGSYQPEYDNSTLIFASQIHVGEIWTYIIRPFDGTDVGVNRTSPAIHIESRPVVHSFTAIPQTDTEGHFILAVNTTDSRNTIKQVEFNLLLNHSLALPPFIQTSPENSFSTRWLYDYLLTNYAYLNTVVTISITVVTEVTYASTYEILLTQSFNFTFQDTAPPRVPNAYFVMNDDLNPTNLTFTAIIEEYGSGIGDVTLSYYFQAVNASSVASGIGASTSQTPTWNEVLMSFSLLNESTGLYIYTVTVDFLHENMDTDIFYSIATADNAGNVNSNAFDIRDYPTRVDDQRFIYQAPGLPEGVLLVAGLAIVLVFFGAIVYVKFIRKPELVGLDKELVLNNIAEVSAEEIIELVDQHTLGNVVAFFDQRHGPIPIIIVPELLKDNFNKLVELADRSFSGTGFSDNFENEIPSSYDFVLDHGIRTSVLSFGFALERPEARGGQENLTLNILVHQDLFPLVQSFQRSIHQKTHEIHRNMNDESTEKAVIRQQIGDLRKYISSIILSYKSIYGTTDLLEEDSHE
ncbi:MAG: hypothetical protein ACXABF_16755, partial [Candidatus Thorarchaeota archaeon]